MSFILDGEQFSDVGAMDGEAVVLTSDGEAVVLTSDGENDSDTVGDTVGAPLKFIVANGLKADCKPYTDKHVARYGVQ